MAILAIAALDLTVRVFEARLSGDIANTRGFPERVSQLAVFPGKRVAPRPSMSPCMT